MIGSSGQAGNIAVAESFAPANDSATFTINGVVFNKEIILAGITALLAWETSDDPRSANAVIAIYSAMKKKENILT